MLVSKIYDTLSIRSRVLFVLILHVGGCSTVSVKDEQANVVPLVRNAIHVRMPELSEEEKHIVDERVPVMGRHDMGLFLREYIWEWPLSNGSRIAANYYSTDKLETIEKNKSRIYVRRISRDRAVQKRLTLDKIEPVAL